MTRPSGSCTVHGPKFWKLFDAPPNQALHRRKKTRSAAHAPAGSRQRAARGAGCDAGPARTAHARGRQLGRSRGAFPGRRRAQGRHAGPHSAKPCRTARARTRARARAAGAARPKAGLPQQAEDAAAGGAISSARRNHPVRAGRAATRHVYGRGRVNAGSPDRPASPWTPLPRGLAARRAVEGPPAALCPSNYTSGTVSGLYE